MAKETAAKKDKEKANCLQAVCVVRHGELLCRSFSLTIVDNVVVDAVELTRAEDVPAIAIGIAQRVLWGQYRQNRGVPSK